jgi:alpha-tubulin suppressor-like RCC1 family protein
LNYDPKEIYNKNFKIMGQIGLDSNWFKISASNCKFSGFKNSYNFLGLKSDGSLFALGSNKFGELGTGDFIERFDLVQIGSSKDWVEIASCCNYNLAIKSDGTLWSWGKNSFGQLGHGDTLTRNRPTKVTPRLKFVAESK